MTVNGKAVRKEGREKGKGGERRGEERETKASKRGPKSMAPEKKNYPRAGRGKTKGDGGVRQQPRAKTTLPGRSRAWGFSRAAGRCVPQPGA